MDLVNETLGERLTLLKNGLKQALEKQKAGTPSVLTTFAAPFHCHALVENETDRWRVLGEEDGRAGVKQKKEGKKEGKKRREERE